MNELENIVKSVVYGGIGAAAAIVEKGGDIARTLVEKGQETIKANQDAVDTVKDNIRSATDDVKRRWKEFCDKFIEEDTIDVSGLTREQRDELRSKLDEMDKAEEAAQPVEAEVTDDDVPVYEAPAEDAAPAAEEAAEPTYSAPEEEE